LDFSQQNDEFKRVKMYFDSQKQLIDTEFQKKYNSETNLFVKENLKKDYNYFIQKIDSVRNVAYLGALIRVKNNEGLKNINAKNEEIEFQNVETPEFPNGINSLREKVAELFYSDGMITGGKELNTLSKICGRKRW
jgi:preprotein translocase subunit SecA